MSDFPMCVECLKEYTDPADRRFHAEPVACATCGPELSWWLPDRLTPDGCTLLTQTGDAALASAIEIVRSGGIVAIKGIGGYHLACDATSEQAVSQLRSRKRRWAKPFAVMVPDVETAACLGRLNSEGRRVLTDPAAPIVLIDHEQECSTRLAPQVLDGAGTVGVMLPYTGVHHLLLRELAIPIVLTSGNHSDEPIAVTNTQARIHLKDIADGFLCHNRRIHSRYEDSVVLASGNRITPLRRGRGYAPSPIPLPIDVPEPLLAVGAQAKHTFAIAVGDRAFISSHIGDLDDYETYKAFGSNLDHLSRLLEVTPEWVAHDIHPAYLSTQYACDTFPRHRRLAIQHHHAHIMSCAGEHQVREPVIGVALDGLGMGDDGTLWGGEVMLADACGYRRLGRFLRAPLPGGASAITNPWRMVVGYIYGAEPLDQGEWCDQEHIRRLLERFDPSAIDGIRRQIVRGLNSPFASSAGRLFDAASSILGIRDVSTYEGEAAIALEQIADHRNYDPLPYMIAWHDGLDVFDPRPALATLIEKVVSRGCDVPKLAAQFQYTIAQAVVDLVVNAVKRTHVTMVCLSGGVFANSVLLRRVTSELEDEGLTVLRHERLPPGDGGISFGQTMIAAARLVNHGKAKSEG